MIRKHLTAFFYVALTALSQFIDSEASAQPAFRQGTDIQSEKDVRDKRHRLIEYIWQTQDLPQEKKVDKIEENIRVKTSDGTMPYEPLYTSLGNLKRIDRYRIQLAHGFVAEVYHFHPVKSNNNAFIYHAGHAKNGFYAEDHLTNNDGTAPGHVIPTLVSQGYDVFALSMPLFEFEEATSHAREDIPRKRQSYSSHDAMFERHRLPYAVFLDPMLATINHIKKNYRHDNIYAIGLSGGGWAVTLYAALDPRIKASFPVAGTMPLWLRKGGDRGDAEQGYFSEFDPGGLYDIANYEDLYVMGSYGNRLQLHILLEHDDCCFAGRRFHHWVDGVQAAMKKLGSGTYEYFLDEAAPKHQVSKTTMSVISSRIARLK